MNDTTDRDFFGGPSRPSRNLDSLAIIREMAKPRFRAEISLEISTWRAVTGPTGPASETGPDGLLLGVADRHEPGQLLALDEDRRRRHALIREGKPLRCAACGGEKWRRDGQGRRACSTCAGGDARVAAPLEIAPPGRTPEEISEGGERPKKIATERAKLAKVAEAWA
jgi:hypothetical protein